MAFAAEAKKRLHIPVAVVGNITSLAEAEEIISSGKANIVVMAKAYMADNNIIHKSVRGHADDVRPCTRCDWCGNANTYGTSMRCAINPMLGKHIDLTTLAKSKKKVMVIGGGAAGMTAAQTCAKMGHDVTLYEKSDKLGGLLNIASAAEFKEYMRLYLKWTIRETERCGCKIKYNTEVTLDMVEQEDPDAIIVSTGSNFAHPPIPGIDGPKVVPVRDVELHTKPVGQKVVVCGGGVVGLEAAVMLGMEGKDVTVIDMIPLENWAAEMPVFNHIELNYQLDKYGVKRFGSEAITEFAEDGVHTKSGRIFEGDTYVLALGVVANRKLADELLSRYPEGVYVVGDCVKSARMLGDANNEAFAAAISIR